MREFDAIIVGAGPSGCAAAFDLARAGCSVLLLDKHSFPRRKPCAGALTIKTVQALRYRVEPVVRAVARGIHVTRDLGDRSEFKSKLPICLMTVRAEFDEFCLRKTIDAGVEFRVVEDVVGVEERPELVALRTPGEEIRGRFVIGADGANSKVRMLLGEAEWFRRGLAVEAHAPLHANAQAMEIDFGVVPGGYAWSFHKGDHLNVGLYTGAAGVKLGRAGLASYLKRKFGSEAYECFVGHYLGMGGQRYAPRGKRAFLVGDAAGMTDPLSGEGIFNAVKSGQAVAAAIVEELGGGAEAGVAYAKALGAIREDLAFCERATGRFYGGPHAGFAALRMPGIKRALMNGYALGMTLSAIRKEILTLPFATVEDSFRVASEA